MSFFARRWPANSPTPASMAPIEPLSASARNVGANESALTLSMLPRSVRRPNRAGPSTKIFGKFPLPPWVDGLPERLIDPAYVPGM